jgi:isohexenylglutaconyl-CoA hydratase
MTKSISPVATASPVQEENIQDFLLLSFNQPEARNPLGPEVIAALTSAIDRAEADSSIRAVILRGYGAVFSAGGNLGNFQDRLAAPMNADGSDPIAKSNRAFGLFLEKLRKFPKPVVVAAHGAAMGGGVGLVCAADIAIVCADTKFCFTETKLGLIPAQILPFVVERIGGKAARRLMLSAERFSAADALQIGLVDFVAPNMDALRDRLVSVLDNISACAPNAVMATKRLSYRNDWETSEQGLSQLLDDCAVAFASAMRDEASEGLTAMREKRTTSWAKRFPREALDQW